MSNVGVAQELVCNNNGLSRAVYLFVYLIFFVVYFSDLSA